VRVREQKKPDEVRKVGWGPIDTPDSVTPHS